MTSQDKIITALISRIGNQLINEPKAAADFEFNKGIKAALVEFITSFPDQKYKVQDYIYR